MILQVIAREDKGAEHGIDYKYSTIVTSFAADISTQGMAAEAVSSPQPRVFLTFICLPSFHRFLAVIFSLSILEVL